MKQISRSICSTIAAIVAFNVQLASAADPSAEETAVRNTAQAFVDAFNKGDAKAVAALWTEDGDYSLGADTVKGRDNIQKLYEEFFKAHPGSTMAIKIDSVRMFAPNVAMEQGAASVRNRRDGAPTASVYSAVHVKQPDGEWLMASVSESVTLMRVKRDLNQLAWLIGNWAAQGDAAEVEITYDWIANKNFIRAETKVHAKEGDQAAIGGTQIIGVDPLSGQLVSWFFNAGGGHGYGTWSHDGKRWLIQTQGATADGVPSRAVNILYHAGDNVMSWRSVNRTLADEPLSDTKEIVIEREQAVAAKK
jgi:uncharacterized protein (TIGR02246 family)